jgi:hypothetical protein
VQVVADAALGNRCTVRAELHCCRLNLLDQVRFAFSRLSLPGFVPLCRNLLRLCAERRPI